MAFGALVKSKDFIFGLTVGLILTFGRVWVPIIEKSLRPLFEFWSNIWPTGLILEIVPLYISGLVIFLLIWWLFFKKRSLGSNSLIVSFKLFSLGFIFSFILFLVFALISVSQFKFAF